MELLFGLLLLAMIAMAFLGEWVFADRASVRRRWTLARCLYALHAIGMFVAGVVLMVCGVYWVIRFFAG